MATVEYGNVQIPAQPGHDDPGLERLLAYLQAYLNNHLSAAWGTFYGPSQVVKVTYVRDPERGAFRDQHFPALYGCRDKSARQSEWIAEDYRVVYDSITLNWVAPPANDERRGARDRFSQLLAKAIDAAIERVRDTSWVDNDDSDPLAQTRGSSVLTRGGFKSLQVTGWRLGDLDLDANDGPAPRTSYPLVQIDVESEELLNSFSLRHSVDPNAANVDIEAPAGLDWTTLILS